MALVALKATMVSSRASSVRPRFCERSARKASLELPSVNRALARMKSQNGRGKRRHWRVADDPSTPGRPGEAERPGGAE
jgi:hypothetical protein